MPALVTLSGRSVRLEPLSLAVVDDLVAAASEDRSTYAFTRVPQGRDEMVSYVEAAMAEQAEGRTMPFAIRWLDTDRLVGATRLMNLEYWQGPMPWPPGIHGAVGDVPSVADIGYTWLAASAQGTGVNRESKYLMLSLAFETWNVHRITLKADVRNERSRAAIGALGAHFDGVRRAESRGADDTVRDTAFYSILRAEWPAVRERLELRLGLVEAAA
ncbi:GNAT family N-acetyltransferase [Nonomuraea typhae]|uniref:GNAT family N-acetyltransferase n=1 Tax=Nonomuraea typhae TaxID=2603600 RepID=A0ABW7YW88_9ACTN